MFAKNSETNNPFVLKRQGKFSEALLGYGQRYAEAQNEGDKYIAEVCFDQMVDVLLLKFLKKGHMFANQPDLERGVRIKLTEVIRQTGASHEDFDEHFEKSWAKFPRQFSVGKEQLIPSKSHAG